MSWHDWWGINQWAAYLEHQELPVKASSKAALLALEADREDLIAPREYADLLLDDPLLALMLLKAANNRLPRHLSRDITTPLGVVLALGTDTFRNLLEAAPEIPGDKAGFLACESHAILAARVALCWGGLHFDLDPGELALAALLGNAGEVELWAFAPELPLKAEAELASGHATRSQQAQQQACGFSFKDLTLRLIDDWNLPDLIRHLIRGDETQRAQLAKLAVDAARHLGHGESDLALPHDALAASKLLHASLKTVVEVLPGVSDEGKVRILQAAEALDGQAPG